MPNRQYRQIKLRTEQEASISCMDCGQCRVPKTQLRSGSNGEARDDTITGNYQKSVDLKQNCGGVADEFKNLPLSENLAPREIAIIIPNVYMHN